MHMVHKVQLAPCRTVSSLLRASIRRPNDVGDHTFRSSKRYYFSRPIFIYWPCGQYTHDDKDHETRDTSQHACCHTHESASVAERMYARGKNQVDSGGGGGGVYAKATHRYQYGLRRQYFHRICTLMLAQQHHIFPTWYVTSLSTA